MFRNLLYTLLGPLVIPQKETIGCSTCFSAVRGSSKAHCHQFVFKSTSAWARMHMRPVLRYLNLASAVGNTNLWKSANVFPRNVEHVFQQGRLRAQSTSRRKLPLDLRKELVGKDRHNPGRALLWERKSSLFGYSTV